MEFDEDLYEEATYTRPLTGTDPDRQKNKKGGITEKIARKELIALGPRG